MVNSTIRVENSVLLGCYAASFGNRLSTFRKNIVPSYLGKYEGIFFWKAGNRVTRLTPPKNGVLNHTSVKTSRFTFHTVNSQETQYRAHFSLPLLLRVICVPEKVSANKNYIPVRNNGIVLA